MFDAFVMVVKAGYIIKNGRQVSVSFWTPRINGQMLAGGSILIAGASVFERQLGDFQILPSVYTDSQTYFPRELEKTLRGLLVENLSNHQMVDETEEEQQPLGSLTNGHLAVAARDWESAAAHLRRLGYQPTANIEPRLAMEMRRYDQELAAGQPVPEPPRELIVQEHNLQAV